MLRTVVVVLALAGTAGCAPMQPVQRCPAGQTLTDGQCLPTPSVVFARCIDAFRKTAVEQHSGTQTKVGAQAKGYGGATVEHGRADTQRAEYSGIPEDLLPEALAECRRQEEQERAGELTRAWSAAEAAEARATEAERRAAQAIASRQRADSDAHAAAAELVQTRTELDEVAERYAAAESACAERWEQVTEAHPCFAEDWARCGEAGREAVTAGDYTRAHQMLRAACEGDDAAACEAWGAMFEAGLGAAADPVAAFGRYEQGCSLGSATACTAEGVMALQGRGTERDTRRARQRFGAACKAHDPQACARQGRMIEHGEAPGELGDAAKLYRAACEDDFARACVWRGDLQRRGWGDHAPSARRAAESYAAACEGGEPEGCLRLSDLYATGDGVPEDPERAATLAARACEGGLSRGCAG